MKDAKKHLYVIQNFFPFSEFLVFNSFTFNFKTNEPQIDSLLTKNNKVSLNIQ